MGYSYNVIGAEKRFKKKHYDPALQLFLISVIRLVLFVVLFILIAGVLGLNITGIAALLAGAGLAVGSALNGTLGNLTGGVMILLLRPFKVGDLIEAQGYFGTVHEIGIVYTILINAENKTILLPNGNLSTGIITNYSQQNNLRINLKFPLKSDVNIDKAREIAIQEILKCNGTIKELAEAWVTDISESQITLQISCRIQIIPYDYKNHQQYLKDYYRTYYTLNENIVKAFIDNNIYKNT
ncbi:MAG: mechanosensitive ion channel family protein [Bacteroidia bacterium]|nr:mechanosensitive ion channel family protein [Bacteroidia bacterium]MCZ2248390.1 mechanosensitive ion channel family protein [Bacteroidia bacterium]